MRNKMINCVHCIMKLKNVKMTSETVSGKRSIMVPAGSKEFKKTKQNRGFADNNTAHCFLHNAESVSLLYFIFNLKQTKLEYFIFLDKYIVIQ